MTEGHSQRDADPTPPAHRPARHRGLLAGAALAVLMGGAAAGASGMRLAEKWQPRSVMLLQPTAVNALQPGSPVAVRGSVAEIFGNKFIVDDGSGRALVDLGPRGESADTVTRGETVTVQGMFDRGFIHAQIVSHADGRTESFGHPPPPRPGAPPPPRRAEAPSPPPGAPPPPPRADAPPPPSPPGAMSPPRADPPPPPLPEADAPPRTL